MNIVEKYGGTSVAGIEEIIAIAEHVQQLKREGHNVVLVCSAMGKMTDRLIELAREVGGQNNKRELDTLLSTGEQRTIALMAMALTSYGVPAVSMTGYQAGFITSNNHAHARIKDIDITNLKHHLDKGEVVVVAGFQGATEEGEITTLGRGGSDTTAVALAARLGYECDIFTDVNGIYSIDPRIYPKARRLKEITYNEMMQMACLGSGVLETRSVELASKYGVTLYVGKSLDPKRKGTYIMEKTNIEDMEITGLSIKEDYAILSVNNIPNDGIFLNELFNMIAAFEINLDTISQQLNDDGTVNFTLYCNIEQAGIILQNASALTKEYVIKERLGFVKLSLVGVGIATHAGIAARVLRVLNENGIKYYHITSSEISISISIEAKDKQKAVEALAKAFDL